MASHAFASSRFNEDLFADETFGFCTGHASCLSPGQPKILEFLAEYGEHEQKDIAEYCDIEPATVGNILLRMEASGLINRRNRPNNRRSLYVSLTPKGEEMAQILRDVFATAEAQITAGLTEEERNTLFQLLLTFLRFNRRQVGYIFNLNYFLSNLPVR